MTMFSALRKNSKFLRKVGSRSQSWAGYSIITNISDENQDHDDPGEQNVEEKLPSSNENRDHDDDDDLGAVEPSSEWTKDCVVQCKYCKQYLYPQALKKHIDLRHLSNKDSTDQSEMFERTVSGIKKDEPSTKSTSKESTKNRGKLQNELLTRNRGGNDASKNKADSFQSQSNTVGDLETKAGPGPGLNSNLETKNTSNLRHSLSKNCILQNKVLERKINNTSNLRHSLSKNCILQNKVLERKTKNTSNDSTVHSGCSYKKKLEVLTRFVAKEDYVQSNSFHDRNDRTTLVSTKKDDKQELKRKHTDNELNKKKVRMKLFFDSKTNKRCVQKFRFRNIENAIGTINAMYDYEPLNRNQKQNPKSILGEELSPSHCRITGPSIAKNVTDERQDKLIFRYESVQSAGPSSGRKMESGLMLYNERCDTLRTAFDSEIIDPSDLNASTIISSSSLEPTKSPSLPRELTESPLFPRGSTEGPPVNELTEGPPVNELTEGPPVNGLTEGPPVNGTTEGSFLLSGPIKDPSFQNTQQKTNMIEGNLICIDMDRSFKRNYNYSSDNRKINQSDRNR